MLSGMVSGQSSSKFHMFAMSKCKHVLINFTFSMNEKFQVENFFVSN